MYERFTDRARKAVQAATATALANNSPDVNSECLLVGLLMDDGTSIAMLALKAAGIQHHVLLSEIRESWGELTEQIPFRKIPLGVDVKQIIEASKMAARDLNHSYVGTEHLLIGVLKVEQCAAAKRLLAAGLTLDKLVAAINPVIPSFDGLSGITDLAEVNKSLSASLITQDRNGKWVMRVPGEGYLYVEDLTAIVAELTAMAKWCCLMTGSSDLDTAACPCGSAAECYFTVEERAELSQVPHVQAAKASKSAYFNSVREKKE